jgi:hypothetical protein
MINNKKKGCILYRRSCFEGKHREVVLFFFFKGRPGRAAGGIEFAIFVL